MALIDGEYYYRPPAKKTVAKKAVYYPKPAAKKQTPVVDQYLQNRGYGTTPATQQQYTPPPPAPVRYAVNGLPSYAQAPAYDQYAANRGYSVPLYNKPVAATSNKSQWFQNKGVVPTTTAKMPARKTTIYEDDAVNYGLPGYTTLGNSPTGAVPLGVRQPITKPTYYTRPPNSPSALRSTAPSKRLAPIYEESATNYGLPGYTVPGMSPTGAPPPGTRKPISLAGLWKGGTYSGNPATANYNVPIYEDQATNYGLPGYTLLGSSPTGAPPPGAVSPWQNAARDFARWAWYGNNPPPIANKPASPWLSAATDPHALYSNRSYTPIPTSSPNVSINQTQSPTSVPTNYAKNPDYKLPQWHPYQYRGEFDPYEQGGSPYKITDPFNFPQMTMAELMASGADPWAHDPYDPAGSPYMVQSLESGVEGSSGGGGWGGWGDGGWGGGGGGGSYGASSGVNSYLPGAGGGYGARASAPNYTGRGAGRGSSYAGSESYNTPQWRMPMLVWNI